SRWNPQNTPDITIAPTINSFSPVSGQAGTLVTINGSYFNTAAAKNLVRFNGIQAVVTSATANKLTAIVPPGALTGLITVLNTGAKTVGRSPTKFTFLVPKLTAMPTTLFESAIGFDANRDADYLPCDLDNDGKVDVVGFGADGVIGFFKNITNPGSINAVSFAGRINIVNTENIKDVKFADMNGDGKLDILTAAEYGSMQIYLNKGAPGEPLTAASFKKFAIPIGYANIAGSIKSIGDMDHDGKLDIVLDLTTYVSDYNYKETVILRNITGKDDDGISFLPAEHFSREKDIYLDSELTEFLTLLPAGKYVDVDIDGDNKTDMLPIVYGVTPSSSTIYRNTSGGSVKFTGPVSFDSTPAPLNYLAQDITGDGKPELWRTSNRSDTYLTLFVNATSPGGPLNSTTLKKYSLPNGTFSNTGSNFFADFDGDNRPDILSKGTGGGFSVSRFNTNVVRAPIVTS
ncbi:MAG: hypothetical protein EOP47_28765, partial [Sphingobacteriaceae bacterium]